ncbi:MAG: DUF4139 domain-containing protein [Gemmataceae bacterium]|nr:DUF4139 domain-containing protein [Gemmataceae bacterium]
MRRVVWIASLVLPLIVTTFILLRPLDSDAEPPPTHPATPAKPTVPHLPITRVRLYTNGVAYFERQGEVDGEARLDLTFPVGDVNDLLKSMVLQDLDGGQVRAASYDSHDPLDKTLQTFAVNLNGSPSLAQLLHQARGEKVEVHLHQGKEPLSGTVIGVEPGLKELLGGPGGRWAERTLAPASYPPPVVGVVAPSSPAVVTSYCNKPDRPDLPDDPARLTLWSADGLRSVPLTSVQRIRFLNPALEREFQRALELLAGSRDNQRRAVGLTFTGEGLRRVRVGYVLESPLWRTTYRLLVDKQGKLFLQGWAIVENQTGDDWKDVRLSLVSGCPISFKMELYQPVYMPRLTVQPDTYASVQPRTHADPVAMPAAQQPIMGANSFQAPAPTAAPAPPSLPVPTNNVLGVTNGSGTPPAQRPAAQAAQDQINLQRGVVAAATAADLGDSFRYSVSQPVSLPRQKSAMLPIVNKPIEGARVSIYNESTHARFPLLALRLKNTSGLHLTAGPVTVFESSGYAGDARLLDLRPGEERLLSYALDRRTEIDSTAKALPAHLTAIRIDKGVLAAMSRARQTRTYRIHNRSTQERKVIVEHPITAGYKVVGKDKPSEQSREAYRFEVKVAGDKTASLEVVEESDQVNHIALGSYDESSLRQLLQIAGADAKVKSVVEKALELKRKLTAVQREWAQQQERLQEIARDQERLRANLKEMPPTAAAYKRYLEKFDRQETEIERLQAQIRELRDVEARQRQEYEAYWGRVEIAPTPARSVEGGLPIPAPAPPVVRCSTAQ